MWVRGDCVIFVVKILFMDDKRLFLLDAYALIYRAYYALIRAPRVTSGGFNTSAIFGFCNTLDEILRKENPSHIAVCFDPKGKTFRHEAFEQYKAQREATPEDITRSIPYIKRIIEAYNIPVIEVERYEADDVIGTLAHRAEREGYTTYMMTPDKDYGQLVTDRVLMYRPSLKGQGFEVRGPREVCERYGIARPEQVIDLLALEGDASDNIPGCPGVGEKTAAKLIAEWGSVESLLENTASLKGALQKRIVENAEQIKFSKFLATIKTDVPVDVAIDSLVRKPENVEALRQVYRELEFKTFLSRLGGVESVPEAAPSGPSMGSLFDFDTQPEAAPREAEAARAKVAVVTTAGEAAEVVKRAVGHTVGVVLSAKGDDAMTGRVTGLALSFAAGEGVYIEMPSESVARGEMAAVIEPLFTDGTTTIVSHELKRDILLLSHEKIEITATVRDTSVAHYLLEPEQRHRLDDLALQYLNTLLPQGEAVPASRRDALRQYGPEEAVMRAALLPTLLVEMSQRLEEQGLTGLYLDIEMPMVGVLARMEQTGVRIDTAELSRLAAKLTSRVEGLEEQVYELAGVRFNIASPAQVGEVLFERLAIDSKAKKTKSGAYSTTEEVLEKYSAAHPIVGLILEIRGLRKLLATYINALPLLINPKTGKIHTTYNQTVTATGRLSSTNPNLQNIPVRTDEGREIRRAFIADEGDLLLSADYSQIELRLMAELSRDPSMVEAFAAGEDIHRATAAKIYHRSLEEVTDTERRNAKTANFGIIYGISAFGLSERLGISRGEAKALIDGYFESYPDIRRYIDSSIEQARAEGMVTTVLGRKRMLPDINSRNAVVRGYAERNAVNAPLQGSAADIIKIAMVDIDREMRARGLQSRMIMQVHDELVFNVKPSELAELQTLVVERMERAWSGLVRLEVQAGVATNWLDAH